MIKQFQTQINDTTITGGTGAMVCQGPAGSGNQGINYLGQVAGNGDQLVLNLYDGAGNFETSNCTVTISGIVVSFTRDLVLSSSNGGQLVNFPASIVNVHNYIPKTLELALMASDLSDLKDAMTLLLDSGNT